MKHWHKLGVIVEAVMRGRRGFIPSLYRCTMTLPAWIYGAIVKGRNRFYDRRGGIKLSRPVISVGNLVAGGTGKSDVVALLARALPGKVAIVSRGYGVKIRQPFVVRGNHGAEVCGDEPRMLANRLKEVMIVVGPDRVAGARLAIERGASVVLLDDGMQYRRLHRDFEIVVLDGNDPFGGNHFLPKGLLREDPKRLEKADLVVINGGEWKPLQTAVRMRGRVEGIFTLQGERIKTLHTVPVALFCGIGNPERFVHTVQELGADIREKLFVPDHKKIKEAELAKLFVRTGVKFLVCTEKDGVKYANSCLPILWIKRSLVVDQHADVWQNALTKIGAQL